MISIIASIAIICGIGWLVRYVGCMALIRYMMDKGCTPPSEEEMKAYSDYVWRKIFHLK